jgi:hypothetical protein
MAVMNTQEHINCTAITWDPTGRFCTTIVSIIRVSTDTGYIVWSFQGMPLQKHLIEKFFSLQWRPRPPSLLNKADIKDIEKNWKEYQTRFEAADKMMQNKASRELIEKRRALRVSFCKAERNGRRDKTLGAAGLFSQRPRFPSSRLPSSHFCASLAQTASLGGILAEEKAPAYRSCGAAHRHATT